MPELTEEQIMRIARSNDLCTARKFKLFTLQQCQQYDAILKVPVQQRLGRASAWSLIEFTAEQKEAMRRIDTQHSERIRQIMRLR